MNSSTRFLLSIVAAGASLSAAVAMTTQTTTAPQSVPDLRTTDLPRGSGGWTEQKVTAVDGMAEEEFGGRVAMQGDTALVSAYAPAGSWQGIVHVFGNVDGEWLPMQQLTANDAAPNNLFGGSLAMSGDTVVIGAPWWPGFEKPNNLLGAAYVFRRVGDTWFQTQMLTLADSEARDQFGEAISFDGTTAMIASYDGGTDGPGAIHVYTKQDGIWTHSQKLTASGPTPPGKFGSVIAVSGDTALAAAIDFNTAEGWVYVLKCDTDGNWSQMATITSPQVSGDFFGRSIAFTDDGKAALVGAMWANVEGDANRGAVYVLSESVDGTWATTQMLSADDGMPGDTFGFVDVDGDSAVISALYADNSVGAAYVFREAGGVWTQQQRLVPSDGVPDNQFGGDGIAISGTTALVGAKWANVEGDLHRGAAYFYSNDKIFAGGFETPAP